jgi:hypothetical protein
MTGGQGPGRDDKDRTTRTGGGRPGWGQGGNDEDRGTRTRAGQDDGGQGEGGDGNDEHPAPALPLGTTPQAPPHTREGGVFNYFILN